MSVIDTALAWALETAADNTHGYDQTNRWGADYDCSSFVISAYKAAGVPLTCTYTGNMRGDMLRCGFADVTASIDLATGAGLRAGDVLLNHKHHTAIYSGAGQIIQASINERGTTTGGTTGDQTGREICERAYYNYPWDCVLRYNAAQSVESVPTSARTLCKVELPQISRGDVSAATAALQAALTYSGYDTTWIDGEFGLRTHNMLVGYQSEHGLTADGIADAETWSALLGGDGV